MLGLPVHETKLGIYKSFSNNTNSIKDYLVVACKNFKIDKDDKFYSFLEVLNNFDPDTTVIKTSYNIGGEVGTLAIIGPKRMEYDKVVTLLDYLKNYIER